MEEIRGLVRRNPDPMPVVAAVIESGGRVLLAQRPGHKHQALKWEFPGGKVEPGEIEEAALIREIREELACEIRVVRPLPRFTHAYDRMVVEMIPFICHLLPGSPDPRPAEHASLAWVRSSELAGYDLAAADLPIAAALQKPAA